jgi:hypothetical protein
MPIRRRLLLLTALSFAPFLLAGMRAGGAATIPSFAILATLLCAGSAIVSALCSWAGLRLADRTQLTMPIFRAWEQHRSLPEGALRRILVPSMVGGFESAVFTHAVAHLVALGWN